MKDRYKKIRYRRALLASLLVCLITISLYTVSLFTEEVDADGAGSNTGVAGGGGNPGGTGTCSGSCVTTRLIAFGYRISLVNGNNDDPTNSGKRISGTHSVDYWQTGYTNGSYPCQKTGYKLIANIYVWSTNNKCWLSTFDRSFTDGDISDKKCVNADGKCGTDEKVMYDNGIRCVFKKGQKKMKQEMKADDVGFTSSDCSSYYYDVAPEEYDKYDNFSGMGGYDYAKSCWVSGEGSCYTNGKPTSGNGIAVNAMTKLAYILTRFKNKKQNQDDIDAVNQFLVDCGYSKSTNKDKDERAKENVAAAGADHVTIQLEPVSALGRSETNYVYIGTSAEQAHQGGHTYDRYWHGPLQDHYWSVTYLHPMIYAGQNKEDIDHDNTTRAGINLRTSNYEAANYKTEIIPSKTANPKNPLGVALYYLPDFGIGSSCEADLRASLQAGDEETYNGLYAKYKKEGKSDEELYFVNPKNYTYADAKFYYDHNPDLRGTLTCETMLECQDKAKAIYNACHSQYNKACTVGETKYDNYEKALIANSYDDNLDNSKVLQITDENYYKNKWNITYMKYQTWLTASFRPTNCKKVSCDQTNVDLIFQNKFNRNKEYKKSEDSKVYSYDEYFDWLQKATGSTFLSKDVWDEIGRPGPECEGTLPNCPYEYSNNCNGVGIPLKIGDNTSDPSNCWKNGVAYTTNTGGIVGSYVKSLTSSNSKGFTNSCRMFCNEQVTFNLPGSPIGYNSDTIRAGTIFKWGVSNEGNDNNIKKNNFGSMTITKQCTIKQDSVTYENSQKQTKTELSDCTGMDFAYPTSTWNEPNSTHFKLVYKDPTNTYQYSNSDNITKTLASSKEFSESECTNKTCSNLTQSDLTTSVTYDLSYSDYLNWYADKSTGEPKAYRTSGSTLTNLAWYKWIGYGLPTSFMTPNGTYGKSSTSDGKLALEITNVGTPKSGGARFDKLVQDKTGSLTLTYSCPFSIINELFGTDCKYDSNGKLTADSPKYCDEDEDDKVDDPGDNPGSEWEPDRYIRDIDVVFRVIDLISPTNTPVGGGSAGNSVVNNAFPGIDGTGRIKGRNWDKLSDSQIENILNENVYNGQPMYSLELNTANIRYIRQLNRDARSKNIDPYSEMRIFNQTSDTDNNNEGYTGYYCVNYDANSEDGKDTYKYCASRFLSLLANDSFKNHGGAKLEGSCFDNVGRNSTANQRATYYAKKQPNGEFGCQRNS